MTMKNLVLVTVALSAAIAGAKDVDVREFGAKGDGATFDTDAVQSAIDACSAAGGGRVTLAGGTFLVKPILLKSGVDLHLDVTARLLGSPDWKDYPNRGTFRHVDSKCLPRARDAALIAADEQERIAISGRGVIDANGMSFVRFVKGSENKKWQYERIGGFDQSPPRVVFFTGCRDVTVTDVTMTNQPAGWSYWIHDCDRVVFDRCKVLADVRFPNNDGIHVNSSRDVSIANCKIETGDDSVVIRCNNRSLKENKVCERVTVANCQLRSYANCIRLGWCQEGVIRDCTFSNIVLHDSAVGINIWFVPQDWNAAGDWGREKTRIENISFSNIVMDRIHSYPITVRVFDPAGFDAVRNISFANMTCKAYGLPQFWGRANAPLEDFTFTNCRYVHDLKSAPPWEKECPDSFSKPGENPFFHCRNFTFSGTTFGESDD